MGTTRSVLIASRNLIDIGIGERNMTKTLRLLVLTLGFVAAVASAPVRAITGGTFEFGVLLSGSYQPATTFAELTVIPNFGGATGNNYTFTLEAFNLNTIFTPGAFIGAMLVNTDPNRDGPPPPVSANPSILVTPGGGVASVAGSAGPSVGGIGWDWIFNFPTSGQGGGVLRLTANESVTWTAGWDYNFEFLDDTYNTGHNAFGLHVQGLTTAQGGSAWYTPPIPEPEIYAMMIAGLGLMGFVARRRKQQAAA